jgi:hypothetical protein
MNYCIDFKFARNTSVSSNIEAVQPPFLWRSVEECGGVWRSEEECGGVWRSVEECGGGVRRIVEE